MKKIVACPVCQKKVLSQGFWGHLQLAHNEFWQRARVQLAERKAAEKAAILAAPVEEPNIIQGKTDRPGYKYHPVLDLSVKQ